jgi:hypothetical protein
MPADKFPVNPGMTCEEFAMAALDLNLGHDNLLLQAAREHMRNCPHCAALQENWQTLRADLHALGQDTSGVHAPARVEMRLRQEFRTKHKTMRTRRSAVVATWALAAAAVLLVAVSWVRWRQEQSHLARTNSAVSPLPNTEPPQPSAFSTPANQGETVVASNGSSDFTLLPGSMPSPTEDTTVVHLQMQRAALGALGLTVNDERAGDWIQVDFLVGDDGQPQAVRLPQSSN